MKPDTRILWAKLTKLLETAKTNKRAYLSLANIFVQVGNNLAARSENGDTEAVLTLGRIGWSYAHIFQNLSIRDDRFGTEVTRPFYESAGYAPGLISDETRNTAQQAVMVKLGRKWSPSPAWGGKSRKRLNFTSGAQYMADRVAQTIYAQPPGKFKTDDEAFTFGFDQLVAGHGGKATFLMFDGPRAIAQSVKSSKAPLKSAGKKDMAASVAVQLAEVKRKVKRAFKAIYVRRK